MTRREGCWVLASGDPDRVSALKGADTGFAFAGDASGGRALIRLIDQVAPSLVVSDMALAEFDGIALIERIRAIPGLGMPYLILLSAPSLSAFNARATSMGASCVLTGPVTRQTLAQAARSLTEERRLPGAEADETRVTEMLWSLGFSPKHKGTRYLTQAILSCARHKRYMENLTAELYPAIARQNDTSAANVQHAIRRAIESAWSSGSIGAQYAFFGNTIDEGRAKPTALAMIARAVGRLRFRQGEDDEYAY